MNDRSQKDWNMLFIENTGMHKYPSDLNLLCRYIVIKKRGSRHDTFWLFKHTYISLYKNIKKCNPELISLNQLFSFVTHGKKVVSETSTDLLFTSLSVFSLHFRFKRNLTLDLNQLWFGSYSQVQDNAVTPWGIVAIKWIWVTSYLSPIKRESLTRLCTFKMAVFFIIKFDEISIFCHSSFNQLTDMKYWNATTIVVSEVPESVLLTWFKLSPSMNK